MTQQKQTRILFWAPNFTDIAAGVLSKSGFRAKVGHGKIKTGLQITLQKFLSGLIGYAALRKPRVSSAREAKGLLSESK